MPEPVGSRTLLWTLSEKLTRLLKRKGQMLVFGVEDGHAACRFLLRSQWNLNSDDCSVARSERPSCRQLAQSDPTSSMLISRSISIAFNAVSERR